MAEILTSQSDLDRIFRKMRGDYNKLNQKQREFVVNEMGRAKEDLHELLADYADSDGTIKRRRINKLLREMDEVERIMRGYGDTALYEVIEESAEFTTNRISKISGVTIAATQASRINKHVVKYIAKRFGDDGLVLSERVWGISGEIRDELSKTVRGSIIKGEGINAMIPKIRETYDNETWKIRRLARTESVTAHRAATAYNAQESDLVEYVQFNDGTCGRKDHHTHRCFELANEDKYGKGAGIYKPSDTEIWLPHPNCTSYITYILDERWL